MRKKKENALLQYFSIPKRNAMRNTDGKEIMISYHFVYIKRKGKQGEGNFLAFVGIWEGAGEEECFFTFHFLFPEKNAAHSFD